MVHESVCVLSRDKEDGPSEADGGNYHVGPALPVLPLLLGPRGGQGKLFVQDLKQPRYGHFQVFR